MKSHSRLFSRWLISTLLLLFFVYYPLKAQTSFEISGDITSDATWSADTVRIVGDINVLGEVILTIMPGTRIKFMRKELPGGIYLIELKGPKILRGRMVID